MRKLLVPLMTPILGLAMIMLPVAANAAQCRDTASGKFAKCGAPGAVPASQYVAKGKSSMKSAHATAAMAPSMKMPAAQSAKPGFFASMKSKAKATSAPAAMPMARCKSAKGKFVKCGTAGAKPA